jgi:uncharacterized protein (TIGR00106 family)
MLAAFSISPMGAGDSVGEAVAAIVGVVRDSGLPNETTAMYTTVEGEWDELCTLLGQCIALLESMGAPRISMVVKVDHRPGHDGMLTSKVESVERRLRGSEGGPG